MRFALALDQRNRGGESNAPELGIQATSVVEKAKLDRSVDRYRQRPQELRASWRRTNLIKATAWKLVGCHLFANRCIGFVYRRGFDCRTSANVTNDCAGVRSAISVSALMSTDFVSTFHSAAYPQLLSAFFGANCRFSPARSRDESLKPAQSCKSAALPRAGPLLPWVPARGADRACCEPADLSM